MELPIIPSSTIDFLKFFGSVPTCIYEVIWTLLMAYLSSSFPLIITPSEGLIAEHQNVKFVAAAGDGEKWRHEPESMR